MRREPLSWWYRDDVTPLARSLGPVAALYDRAGSLRAYWTTPYRAALPVICIGNFVAGGAGKTPAAVAIAALLAERGAHPGFLTRGYGGRRTGPHWVSVTDPAAEVGDEPLLLARYGPVMLARNRRAGARAMLAVPAGTAPIDVIVMDDGLQNPQLFKDLSIAVVDGGSGLGNGRVMPAGPLRRNFEAQVESVDAVIIVEGAGRNWTAPAALRKPVFTARVQARGSAAWLSGARVIAFAGIGRPEKFFETLRGLGANLIAGVPFPDHHGFTPAEARDLVHHAQRMDALLVTTEKDWLRLPQTGPLAPLRDQSRPLPIDLVLAPVDRARLATLLGTVLKR